ncbi:hypothetical protein DFJ74DRAFT_694402 [Hyaloraphidium curvatum]|nr:hypothetical protein DFJ74DRAFT_694402 [Hyaloraphidium curvatum]
MRFRGAARGSTPGPGGGDRPANSVAGKPTDRLRSCAPCAAAAPESSSILQKESEERGEDMACLSCRKLKRKCADRGGPCLRCRRKGLECSAGRRPPPASSSAEETRPDGAQQATPLPPADLAGALRLLFAHPVFPVVFPTVVSLPSPAPAPFPAAAPADPAPALRSPSAASEETLYDDPWAPFLKAEEALHRRAKGKGPVPAMRRGEDPFLFPAAADGQEEEAGWWGTVPWDGVEMGGARG